MKNKTISATVTATNAIIKQGSRVELLPQGGGVYIVDKSNGVRINKNFTLMIRASDVTLN